MAGEKEGAGDLGMVTRARKRRTVDGDLRGQERTEGDNVTMNMRPNLYRCICRLFFRAIIGEY